MKRFSAILFAAIVSLSLIAQSSDKYDYLYENLPFSMPKVEVAKIPSNKVSVTDFGAKGDAVTLNTEAFAKAIQAVSALGGGTVEVPAGVWYTGPITFVSNLNLHLKDGAVIVFSSNFDDYKLIDTSFEGLDTKRCIAPLNAVGATNIAITGNGTIDGNGDAWRPVKKGKMTPGQWSKLTKKGKLNDKKDFWFPTDKSFNGWNQTEGNFNVPILKDDQTWDDVKDWLRPVLLSFVSCKNVLLQGVTFQNSPSWNLHPNMCENVILDGVSVRNPWYSQNGDGLDLESCTNAIVVNSTFDVGDDAICIKSGKDADGRRRGMPCQNVIVDNCVVYHGHGGFVVGSEMSGGVKNISVRNCHFLGTDVGLRFKSTRGRGGVVENIYVDNCNMINIPTEPLLFDLYYGGKSAVEELEEGSGLAKVEKIPAVTEETPAFRNIFITNIACRGARRAMFFNGLPEMNIENVVVENASIYAEIGAELSEADGVVLKNVNIVPAKGAALMLNNVKNVKVEGFTCPESDQMLQVTGSRTAKVSIKSSSINSKRSKVADQVKKGSVSIK
ncbi:MAG: glycoside hydrolase family 28 protein [Bacteroidales bacterium]